MSRETGQLIKKLRRQRGLKLEKLAELVDKSPEVLRKFEGGRRVVDPATTNLLRKELCESDSQRSEFDSIFERAARPLASPLTFAIDSPNASLRVIPVPYPPFSGEDTRFLDALVKKMLELAVIRYEVPEQIRNQSTFEQFDVNQRIDWLMKRDADVLFNLASLQRLKKVRFLLTPIRVSLNGVMLRREGETGHLDIVLAKARNLLAKRGLESQAEFRLFAIRNEVGWVHLVQNVKIPVTDISSFATLSPSHLADALKGWDGCTTPLLVCDEITAMSVVGHLKGEGALVFQPSSDDSVMNSSKRRSLPAHPLGIGLRRDDWEIYSYLSEALRTFLTYETETIAVMYEALYEKLLATVQECLQHDSGLYLGGVRRVSMAMLDSAQKEGLAYQNARAYARRCLQLNRNSITSSADLQSWLPVLRRARARVQASEAKNRKAVKLIAVSSLKTVLGLDLIKRGLGLTYQDFQGAIHKQWAALKYILEREMDVDFPLQDSRFRDQLAENDLEYFVSQMQKTLEVAGEAATVTAVTKIGSQDREAFSKLLSERWGRPAEHLAKTARPVHHLEEGAMTFLARNLGELVGFIIFHARKTDTKTDRHRPQIELEDIYVVNHMRGAGVSYRMIREVIDYADREGSDSVWFDRLRREDRIIELFHQAGFADHGAHILAYKLDRLKLSARSAQATA